MKNILMASAAVLALSSTANAEGNFQGFYAGGNLGIVTQKETGEVRVNNLVNDSSIGRKGFNGGVFGGYNHQINMFVLGLEGYFNYGGYAIEGRIDDDNFFDVKRKDAFGIAARIGIDINGWIMPYARIGFETAKFGISGKRLGNGFDRSGRASGFVLGGGVEAIFKDCITVGAEFASTNYSDRASVSNGLRVNEVKFRLGYKF